MRIFFERTGLFYLLAIVVAAVPVPSIAQDDPAADAKLEVRTLALFKNGLGFIGAEAQLPGDADVVRFGQLPVPAFGTFWVAYPPDVKLRKLVTSMESQQQEEAARNLRQLLAANPGKHVNIYLSGEQESVVFGVVMPGQNDPELPDAPNPYMMEERRASNPYNPGIVMPPPAEVVLIDTSDGVVAVNYGHIKRIEFEGQEFQRTVAKTVHRPSLRLELDEPAGGKSVTISTLARGVTWSPAYNIDLTDAETAHFSARALVINEMMDFDNVRLELVTGFPNIKFGNVLSPIAMSESLADFLKSLATGGSEAGGGGMGGRGYMMAQSAVMSNTAFYDEFRANAVPSYSTAAEGAVSEDLFLYPVEKFSLKKGETAWLPLFTAEMPYEHIYCWSIPDALDEQERYRYSGQPQTEKKEEEVWHSCRLVNTLKMPLTTAATQFTTGGSFTGQDVCYYTAPGSETTIRINRAMNVVAEQAEFELERRPNAQNFHGSSYDEAKVRGELRLRSRLDKPVKLEVTKELSGEVSTTDPKAESTKTAKGLTQVNPKYVLKWEFELEAGSEKMLTYEYTVYVRN